MALKHLRYRLRAALEKARFASKNKAPKPRLSVAVMAQDCLDQLQGLVDNVRSLAMEVVVVDGGSKDGSLDYCRREPLIKLIERPFTGDFAAQKNTALEACEGDWILHLDCDERIGPGLRTRLPALCARADVHFYRLPMYWLVAERPARYVVSDKHFPSWCPRLMRNRPEHRYDAHNPVHVTFPSELVRSMTKVYGAHLFHYCFVWLSREQLEQKAKRYRRDHPGSEHITEEYYLYWKHPHKIRRCEEQPD